MVSARGVKRAGFYDCPGGGQVSVVDGIAYIGHIHAPSGTSIVDVKDPKNPKQLAYYEMAPGTHSHKARVGPIARRASSMARRAASTSLSEASASFAKRVNGCLA